MAARHRLDAPHAGSDAPVLGNRSALPEAVAGAASPARPATASSTVRAATRQRRNMELLPDCFRAFLTPSGRVLWHFRLTRPRAVWGARPPLPDSCHTSRSG